MQVNNEKFILRSDKLKKAGSIHDFFREYFPTAPPQIISFFYANGRIFQLYKKFSFKLNKFYFN
jgi:hypothetical protein